MPSQFLLKESMNRRVYCSRAKIDEYSTIFLSLRTVRHFKKSPLTDISHRYKKFLVS